MRATIAAATALLIVALSPSLASAFALRQMSLTATYDRCVQRARSRGYTDKDLDQVGSAARAFVLRCMRGRLR